ncbi:hypothetical protein V0R50_15550 [Pseudomonas sp. 148P]|uniref:Lipoprotein n=1 Tax=Pseudomonas ulcerans TaxID=3115852 RepID=A0ABU7HSZ3_9PSED|nr:MULTISPECIES: hypothetical protein [unclassified Pseudomonas]MEE1920700.1 hypothetical protein [Pseudomonas sp. 147P]MEE1934643.1 hypothetical protein [Pseudomonas sp. 148P]
MRTPALLLILASLASANALADACQVTTRSSSPSVPAVDVETCYTLKGMPAEAISWSCSNENKEMLNTEKRRVARCPDKEIGQCSAPLTQESLANPRATSNDPDGARPAIPDDAQVVTYYYDTRNQGQARIDCEKSGGTWRMP